MVPEAPQAKIIGGLLPFLTVTQAFIAFEFQLIVVAHGVFPTIHEVGDAAMEPVGGAGTPVTLTEASIGAVVLFAVLSSKT